MHYKSVKLLCRPEKLGTAQPFHLGGSGWGGLEFSNQ